MMYWEWGGGGVSNDSKMVVKVSQDYKGLAPKILLYSVAQWKSLHLEHDRSQIRFPFGELVNFF